MSATTSASAAKKRSKFQPLYFSRLTAVLDKILRSGYHELLDFMDDLDRQLLLFLQNGIPLQKRPFDGIASRLGLDSADVLLRISRLKLKKHIRRLTAILDGRPLGYERALAAMRMPSEKLEAAAGGMKSHPGVIQCDLRKHEFNLWLTLALPARMLEPQIRRLHATTGAKKTIFLPELKRFKGRDSMPWPSNPATANIVSLSALEISILRKIQENFPLDDQPFHKWAGELGITEAELLEILGRWTSKGCLKKIAALSPVPSPAAGNEKTTLAVWEVPEERQEKIGRALSRFEEVADCVQRPAYPEFPYAIHARLQAEDPESAQGIAEKISGTIGRWPFCVLGNIQEIKKVRLKYFSEGLEDWELEGATR